MRKRRYADSSPSRKLLYAFLGGAAGAVGRLVVDQLRLGEIQPSRSVWFGVGVAFAIWLASTIISKVAEDRRRRTQGRSIQFGPGPVMEEQAIGEVGFENVRWKVVERVHSFDAPFHRGIRADKLRIKIPPRCPVCGSELNQSQRYWGSWDWFCPAGHFSIRKPRDYGLVADDVLKLARRDVETMLAKKGRQ